MQKKNLDTEMASEFEGPVTAKISTVSVDRDGEVMIPQGMNSQDFEKNPMLFWNHDYGVPVGNVTRMVRKDNYIEATLTFGKRPSGFVGEFFPSFVESMVRQGIVKGVSVGFVPEDGGVRNATKKDKSVYGRTCDKVYNKWKLLEVSVAPLPANQDALINSVHKGMLSRHLVKQFLGVDIPKANKVRPRHAIRLAVPKSVVRVNFSKEKAQRTDTERQVRAEIARFRGQIYL